MKKANYVFRYAIIVVVFLVLFSIFYDNYQNTIQIVKSKYNTQHEVVEGSINNTIKYANAISRIAETEASGAMENYSSVLIDKYNQNPNVLEWNLEELKKQFGNSDIYIISDQLKIVKTTFREDLGLDFTEFPSFSRTLEKRLKGNSFVTDHMDISTNTGLLMKYGYVPTPDHRFLIELGINMSERFPVINDLDIFSAVDNLTGQYQSISEISVYKLNEKGNGVLSVSKDKPFYETVTDNNKKGYIQQSVKSGEVQEYTTSDSPSKIINTYKYIPYISYQKSGEYDWWNSYIIEITYNDNVMLEEINRTKGMFWHSLIIIAAVFIAFTLIITHLFRKSEYMAYHDHLTDLPNRKMFEEYLNYSLIKSKRSGNKMAVLFLDLNNFKEINDTLGHNVGDALLQMVAKKLKSILRKDDIISRLGGDEFIILLSDIDSYEDAVKVASKINRVFDNPIDIDKKGIQVSASIGISIYPDHSSETEGLIQKADIAMYHAKRESYNYMIYNNGII